MPRGAERSREERGVKRRAAEGAFGRRVFGFSLSSRGRACARPPILVDVSLLWLGATRHASLRRRRGRSILLPPTADSESSVHRSAAKNGPSQVLLGGGGGDEVWEGIRFQTLDTVEEALFASTRAFVAENKAVQQARSRVAP